MGQNFLIDTNVVIDFQRKVIDDNFTISFISYIEVLGYNGVTEPMEMPVALANVIEADKTIINKTIQLRKTRKIMIPDAIIAATAIVYDATLLTNNVKDFINIKGLRIVNPHKL